MIQDPVSFTIPRNDINISTFKNILTNFTSQKYKPKTIVVQCGFYYLNKKALLRERKRHTARRVAIASPCYSRGGRGGSPLDKKFFPQSEHVSSQIWCQKFFPLLGGVPWQKFFFQVWTCIKPNLVSKNFPFTGGGSLYKNFFPNLNMYQAKSGVKNFPLYSGGGGGGYSTKKFFPSLNMYQAKSGVKNFPLYWGGGSLDKNFFSPVWTCIKPNLVSKIFPFMGGGSVNKKFFSSLNMYQAKSGVKKFSLYWDRDPPLDLRLGNLPNLKLGAPPDLDLGPHLPGPGPGTPLPGPGPGTPPTWTWTWDPPLPGPETGYPPSRGVDWHTKWKYNLPHPSDAGGNYIKLVKNPKQRQEIDERTTAFLCVTSFQTGGCQISFSYFIELNG